MLERSRKIACREAKNRLNLKTPMAPEHTLKAELSFFTHHKDEWLVHYEGKFALIKGQHLAGTFTTLEEAYNEAVKQFGTEPFLVKQIVKDEPTQELPALMLGLLYANL